MTDRIQAWDAAQDAQAPEINKPNIDQLIEQFKQEMPEEAMPKEMLESTAHFMRVLTDNTELVLDPAASDEVYTQQMMQILGKATFFATMDVGIPDEMPASSFDNYLNRFSDMLNSGTADELISGKQKQVLSDYITQAHEDGIVTKQELFDFGVLGEEIGAELLQQIDAHVELPAAPSLSSMKAAASLLERSDIEPTEARVQNMAARGDMSAEMFPEMQKAMGADLDNTLVPDVP